MKEKMKEVIRLVESRAAKEQRGQTLPLLSLQKDVETVCGQRQQLHHDLEQTDSHHTWSLTQTQDAVARLLAVVRQAIEKNRQAIAGAIAVVEERGTITQSRTQQELEEN